MATLVMVIASHIELNGEYSLSSGLDKQWSLLQFSHVNKCVADLHKSRFELSLHLTIVVHHLPSQQVFLASMLHFKQTK